VQILRRYIREGSLFQDNAGTLDCERAKRGSGGAFLLLREHRDRSSSRARFPGRQPDVNARRILLQPVRVARDYVLDRVSQKAAQGLCGPESPTCQNRFQSRNTSAATGLAVLSGGFSGCNLGASSARVYQIYRFNVTIAAT
jgi:hypothetical protein